MTNQDQAITEAINTLTQKISHELLQAFLELPKELQLNIVLIKSAQLLLANILCHVATNQQELESVANDQGVEIKELTMNCAFTGFSDKYDGNKH